MFYSDFVLSKKGPLARIWLAAHWDKKLTKAQIFETNIESSIERILKPKVKLALRTSGHLMLGVVRIYSRKTKYLLADCNEAFVKIKMAFRPGMVDLPEDHREAAVHAVTLPEVFHDFDSAIPDLNDVDIEAQFALNQSRADEITIHEDYANVPLHSEDGFDLGFDASSSDIMNHPSGFDESLQQTNVFMLAGIESMDKQKDGPSTSDVNAASSVFSMDVDIPKNHGFGGGLLEGRLFEDAPMLQGSSVDNSFQVHDLQDEPIPSTSKHAAHLSPMNQRSEIPLPNDDDDFDDDHFVPASPGGGSSDGSRPPSPIGTADQAPTVFEDAPVMQSKEPFSGPGEPEIPGSVETQAVETAISQEKEVTEQNENQNVDQTTLVQNEEESFALAPVDASALRGLPKTKRKRKLIVDEVKNISGEEMKAQLSDTSDIVITLDLAPPTKRLMHWKETGGVEKLFALPGKGIPSTSLFKNYQRHLTSRAAPNDDMDDHDGIRNDHEVADMPPPANPVPSKRGRKRKQPVVDELPQIPQNVQELPDRQSIELTETNDAVVKKLKTTDSPIEEKQPRRESEVAVKDPISLGARPDQDNSLQLQESMSLPTPNESLQEQAPEPMEVPPPYLDANQQTFTESLQIPPTCPEIGNDQPADNLLAFTPTPQPTQDMNQVPVGFEDNMSINNNDNTIMENMGYDERDNDMQQLQNSNLFQFNNDDNDNAPITPGMHPGAVTPWHDADYDNPASIGPMEERGIDETMEQFEERLLNKRAGHLYSTVRMRISTGVTTTFNDLIIGNPKKQVAQKFYSLLVLKKHRVLELTQSEPYDVILLTKGPNFDDPKL